MSPFGRTEAAKNKAFAGKLSPVMSALQTSTLMPTDPKSILGSKKDEDVPNANWPSL